MGVVKNKKPVLYYDSKASLELKEYLREKNEALLDKLTQVNLKIEELYNKHLPNQDYLRNTRQIKDVIRKTNEANKLKLQIEKNKQDIQLLEEERLVKKNIFSKIGELFKKKDKLIVYYSKEESNLLRFIYKNKINIFSNYLEFATNKYIDLGAKIAKFTEVVSYDAKTVEAKQEKILKKIKKTKNESNVYKLEREYNALTLNKFEPKSSIITKVQRKHYIRQLFKTGKKIDKLKAKIQKNHVRISRINELNLEKLNLFGRIIKGFNSLNYKQQKVIFGILFLMPWIIGFCIFFAYPLSSTIWWSFNNMTVKEGGGFNFAFVGFENYSNLFKNVTLAGITFTEMLSSSMLNILINLPVIIIFSLLIAVVINKKFKGHQLVKAIFFIPVVFNMSVINNTMQGVFGQMLEADITQGFALSERFGDFLYRIGIGSGLVEFLIAAVDRIFTIVNMSGIQILMFIAGLQSIPVHLYEAAKVEGATKYEMFWKITIPMVSPIILTTVVYTVVDSFATSQIMQFLTVNSQGTTMSNTQPGLYSAISIIYFLANALIIVFIFVALKKLVFYYDE